MGHDFSVAWQISHPEKNSLSLWITLNALIQPGVSLPSFDTVAWNGVFIVWDSQSHYSLKKFGFVEV
jgi:hypothetical protein